LGEELRARDVDALVHLIGELGLAVGGGQMEDVIDAVRGGCNGRGVVDLAAYPFEARVFEAVELRRRACDRAHAAAALAELPYEHAARESRGARDEDEIARAWRLSTPELHSFPGTGGRLGR